MIYFITCNPNPNITFERVRTWRYWHLSKFKDLKDHRAIFPVVIRMQGVAGRHLLDCPLLTMGLPNYTGLWSLGLMTWRTGNALCAHGTFYVRLFPHQDPTAFCSSLI